MENIPVYYTSIAITKDLETDLGLLLSAYPEDKLFLVTEEKCDHYCVPLISSAPNFGYLKKIVIPSGEENKKLSSVEKIWMFLSNNGADRKSLVVNLGGGMLTDLGSFAASTMKRGMDFVNIPTTLLSQVDASVGGKTGFNFNGLKNEIGVINQPTTVLIDTKFLKTIDHQNFLSGYAEMIKHGLIYSTDHLKEVKEFDLDNIDYETLRDMIGRSIAIKDWFVFRDPTEKNYRKALNFGHTVGHAFESHAMQIGTPIHHGYAVAYGMIAELYLSHTLCNFPAHEMEKLVEWINYVYGKFPIHEDNLDTLVELMTHDKKNEGSRINFTLLTNPGEVEINQNCHKKLIFDALRFYMSI